MESADTAMQQLIASGNAVRILGSLVSSSDHKTAAVRGKVTGFLHLLLLQRVDEIRGAKELDGLKVKLSKLLTDQTAEARAGTRNVIRALIQHNFFSRSELEQYVSVDQINKAMKEISGSLAATNAFISTPSRGPSQSRARSGFSRPGRTVTTTAGESQSPATSLRLAAGGGYARDGDVDLLDSGYGNKGEEDSGSTVEGIGLYRQQRVQKREKGASESGLEELHGMGATVDTDDLSIGGPNSRFDTPVRGRAAKVAIIPFTPVNDRLDRSTASGGPVTATAKSVSMARTGTGSDDVTGTAGSISTAIQASQPTPSRSKQAAARRAADAHEDIQALPELLLRACSKNWSERRDALTEIANLIIKHGDALKDMNKLESCLDRILERFDDGSIKVNANADLR